MSRTLQIVAAGVAVVFVGWCWEVGRLAGAHWRALRDGVAL